MPVTLRDAVDHYLTANPSHPVDFENVCTLCEPEFTEVNRLFDQARQRLRGQDKLPEGPQSSVNNVPPNKALAVAETMMLIQKEKRSGRSAPEVEQDIKIKADPSTPRGHFMVRGTFQEHLQEKHRRSVKHSDIKAVEARISAVAPPKHLLDDVCTLTQDNDGFDEAYVRIDYLDTVREVLYGSKFPTLCKIDTNSRDAVLNALKQQRKEDAAYNAAQAAEKDKNKKLAKEAETAAEKNKKDAEAAAAAAEKAKAEAAAAAEAERKDKEAANMFELSSVTQGLRMQRMQLSLAPQPLLPGIGALEDNQVCSLHPCDLTMPLNAFQVKRLS